PAGVEDGIRAAMDDQPAVYGQLGIITQDPHAGKALEVGGAVAAAIRVVPEAQRHGWESAGADQLALLTSDPLPLVVPYLHRHAPPRALQFAAPDWLQRIAKCKAGDDIGTPGNRGQLHVPFDVAVPLVEALRRQWRAG